MALLDGLRSGLKKVVAKVGEARQTKKESDEQSKKLFDFKDKFEKAKAQWDYTAIDERELIYNGTHAVDRDINSPFPANRKTGNVINIVYEFVEAQVDTTIPQPTVKSKRKEFAQLAKVVENSARADIDEMGIERINDENERTTPVQGYSMIRVDWDPDYDHHLYKGEIKLSNPHPKQFIPQPGVFNVQEMDYFFLLYSMTKGQVKKRYNIEVESEGEQMPEINYFHDAQSGAYDNSEKVTVIVCWYKDDDGDIGKFSWCNETVLEDLPRFYYRRIAKCTACGAPKGMTDICELCGNTKFRKVIEDTEALINDVQLSDGTVIPAGTEIPYFQPTRYPVVIRRNVPVAFQLGGQSDVDVIRDQQDALKKVVHRLQEKIVKSGYLVKADLDHKFNLSNELYQVVRGSQNQLMALGTVDLSADISKDLDVAQYMYKAAQDALGITNSWMGKEDQTANSGVAKQIQVQQASGRMESKRYNKYTAFKELYEIMFEFKLAYYDELRPYLMRGPDGKEDWGEFNKYEFLVQDASGQWYYNTDFLFSVSAGDGFPKDRMWIEQQAREMFNNKAIDKVGLWQILESVNYPMAAEMLKRAEDEQQMLQQQAQAQAMGQGGGVEVALAQLSPEERAAFEAADPATQQAVLQEAMGGGVQVG
jgi:hypothetical protein